MGNKFYKFIIKSAFIYRERNFLNAMEVYLINNPHINEEIIGYFFNQSKKFNINLSFSSNNL